MTSLEILTEARRLIDVFGHATSLYETTAGCLCTTGALIKAYDPTVSAYGRGIGPSYTHYITYDQIEKCRDIFVAANDITKRINEINAWGAVYRHNDKSTKEEVLAMFDKAISLAKETENG
jgi:hypothetical protein